MTHRNNFGSVCISLWICQGREGSEELNLSKSSQLVCITRTKWLSSGSLVRPRLWHYQGYTWSRMSGEPQGESCFLTPSNSPLCSWWEIFIAQTSSKFCKSAAPRARQIKTDVLNSGIARMWFRAAGRVKALRTSSLLRHKNDADDGVTRHNKSNPRRLWRVGLQTCRRSWRLQTVHGPAELPRDSRCSARSLCTVLERQRRKVWASAGGAGRWFVRKVAEEGHFSSCYSLCGHRDKEEQSRGAFWRAAALSRAPSDEPAQHPSVRMTAAHRGKEQLPPLLSHQEDKSRTRPTPVTSQHISLLPYCQLCSRFFQHQIKMIFFLFCSSRSLYLNIRLWTQNKSPSWKWSLKTRVIHRLIVPRAFPFKIFALSKWEVKNLYFALFVKHSLHPWFMLPGTCSM